jgi:hypothetical protein
MLVDPSPKAGEMLRARPQGETESSVEILDAIQGANLVRVEATAVDSIQRGECRFRPPGDTVQAAKGDANRRPPRSPRRAVPCAPRECGYGTNGQSFGDGPLCDFRASLMIGDGGELCQVRPGERLSAWRRSVQQGGERCARPRLRDQSVTIKGRAIAPEGLRE